jgi:hypothetical protein
MTDDQLDAAVRDADPYRPGLAGRLDGADETLLEEIMSEKPATASWRRRLLPAVAAAAALTVALALPAVLRHRTDGERAAAIPTASAAVPAPADPTAWKAIVLKAAEQNPRLLIDEPGWTVTSVYGFVEDTGEIRFTRGDRVLEMNWYPQDEYRSYYVDRLDVSKPRPDRISGGWAGDVFTYSASDFALMLKPRDDSFVELRTGGRWTRETFDQVLTHVKRADVKTWLAAMPPEIVTPERAGQAVIGVLAGVPLPPKFDTTALYGLGTNDAYQFGAQVMARVGCGWIGEWLRARRTGDVAAAQRAVAALRSSHNWAILKKMDADGGYPEVFWQYADRVAAGQTPSGYQQGLGCP